MAYANPTIALPRPEIKLQLVNKKYIYQTEELHRYRWGGSHPVHIGEYFGPNNRYRVLNKLGNGSYGVVWLCKDRECHTTPWKALKINNAAISKADCAEMKLSDLFEQMNLSAEKALYDQIAIPYKNFWMNGPNGRHLCNIVPILGRNIEVAADMDPKLDRRKLCRRVIKAMQFLHSIGVNHGDFRPDNILTQVEGLQLLDEREIMLIFGRPRVIPTIHLNGGKPYQPNQPEYLVLPTECDTNIFAQILYQKYSVKITHNPKVAVVDFGGACHTSWKKPWATCIPYELRCPAVILGYPVTHKTDIFALGVTLSILMTGEMPYLRSHERYHIPFRDYFPGIEEGLGPMPLELRKRCERMWKQVGIPPSYKPAKNLAMPYTTALPEIMKRRSKWVGNVKGAKCIIHGQMLERGIRMAEADVLLSLIDRCCAWLPESRLDIDAVMEHPWVAVCTRKH